MTDTLFVNYRPQDQPLVADLLASQLCRAFGPDVAFYAARALPPGERWRPPMTDAVRDAAALVTVIGPDWLADAHDPDDYVRAEIKAAFDHGVRVLALRLPGAPRPDDLPADIAGCPTIPVDDAAAGLRRHLPALRVSTSDTPVARFAASAETVRKAWAADMIAVAGDWDIV